jgi:uncharacterized protein
MACPICNKETNEQYRPFCAKRCADVDLHRWLGGQYAIGDDGDITHNTEVHQEFETKPNEIRFDD